MEKISKSISWICEKGEISEITFLHANNPPITDIDGICYIEHCRGLLEFHYKNKIVQRTASVDHVEKQLPAGRFFRVKRGMIINLGKVIRCVCRKQDVVLETSYRKRALVKGEKLTSRFFACALSLPNIKGIEVAYRMWCQKSNRISLD